MKPDQRYKTFYWQILRPLTLIVLLAGAVFGWRQQAVAPAAISAVEREAVAKIKVETIREVVTALSADEMQGRGTAQPGGDKAATYLADQFQKLGLKPLGNNGSYFQPIKFRESQFLPETNMMVGKETYKLGSDFIVTPPLSGDKSISGNLVFVAYGLISTTPKRNDLAGINLNGKIVVMLQGPPRIVSKDSWKKARVQFDIVRNLVAQGAAAIVFINQGREEHSYAETANYLIRRQIEPADSEEMPAFVPPFLNLSDAAAEKLFSASGVTRAEALSKAEAEGFTPIELKQSAKVTVRLKKGKGVSNNVVGLLEGSDQNLKSEAVVYSAHYDAYGMSADNRIYHGAADNALGVAEMLSIAEAFSRITTRPRRSIIFMAVTGEEYGGHGSDHWVKNPTWKIKQVAANLNLDGMGTEVYAPVKVLVAYGAEHSSLGTTLIEVAAATGLKVIPDPMPEEKAFYRSDHYFFVKKGIPGLMLLGAPEGEVKAWVDRMKLWEKTDYHQPTDTIRPDWNWDGPKTMASVGVVLGLRVANQDQMPAWFPTSPFNRERGTNQPPPPEP
ncbi:MAG TPA: M28 family metallopeptidase [Pyrinomonadaceae bacterium]|nr:M28 family metallopeptidase [Pyrinomonadaceae bacterium]